jgi:hypothetical protein
MADSVRETRTEAAQSVRESRTLNGENNGNSPSQSVRESLTHILHHIPGEEIGSEQPNSVPEKASGPPANLAAAEAEEAQHALRDKITAHWTGLAGSGRKAWAADHGLSFGELRDFIIAGAPLPFTKQVALWSAARRAG